MPIAHIRGIDINYEILGGRGPWVALQPGGRRGLVAVKPVGLKLAEAGFRVLVYDRRNCGASQFSLDGGESENVVWAEDLQALLSELDALPAYIGGSSSGCRMSLILALRHRQAVRGLLLWRVTGGAYAARQLAHNYYTQFIEMARQGGMAAVAESEHFGELIASNPANRERLLSIDPQHFIAVMERWHRSFAEGADHPVIGVSEQELRSLAVPACIIPGNDRVHPREPGQIAHRLMPASEYHEVLTEDRPDVDVALEDWEKKEGLLAAILIDFLRRAERRP
ncbi:MAG TPA: alpha/beta hydrolase [Stellaceae bacterium]|nr:alpha/beta hydrolase [Stellaceae bacterium]